MIVCLCFPSVTVADVSEQSLDSPASRKGNAYKYRLNELKSATNNFSKKNVIGEGSFGEVFRGSVVDKGTGEQIPVAVKVLNHDSQQGMDEWLVSKLSCTSPEKLQAILQHLITGQRDAGYSSIRVSPDFRITSPALVQHTHTGLTSIRGDGGFLRLKWQSKSSFRVTPPTHGVSHIAKGQ